jgi:hypothetical protein
VGSTMGALLFVRGFRRKGPARGDPADSGPFRGGHTLPT